MKFRLWDIEKKKFNWEQNFYINSQFTDSILMACPNDNVYYRNKFVIQQFIYLLDIKNIEIFEGDIIKQPKVINFYKPTETEEILVVGFSKIQCGFRGFRHSNLIGAGNLIKEDAEIIGNVFENRELLNNE